MRHKTDPRRWLAAVLGATGLLFIGSSAIAEDPARLNGVPLRSKNPPVIAYPPALVRLNVSGRVVLAYSIGVDGKPEKITVLVSDDSRLEGPAADILRKYEFDVPKTWESDGGLWRRFHLQMTFGFEGDPPRQKLVEDGEVITVTFSILKVSPGVPSYQKPR
jgi:outer membrane biosynthesis protein TonB